MTKFEEMEPWEKKLRGSIVGFHGSSYADRTDPDAFYRSYLERMKQKKDVVRITEAIEHGDLFIEIATKLLRKE